LQVIVTSKFALDGCLEASSAINRRVFGSACMDRRNRGVFDSLRRVKVRLTGAETDDVSSGRLEFGSHRQHGAGRRRLDPRHTFRN